MIRYEVAISTGDNLRVEHEIDAHGWEIENAKSMVQILRLYRNDDDVDGSGKRIVFAAPVNGLLWIREVEAAELE